MEIPIVADDLAEPHESLTAWVYSETRPLTMPRQAVVTVLDDDRVAGQFADIDADVNGDGNPANDELAEDVAPGKVLIAHDPTNGAAAPTLTAIRLRIDPAAQSAGSQGVLLLPAGVRDRLRVYDSPSRDTLLWPALGPPTQGDFLAWSATAVPASVYVDALVVDGSGPGAFDLRWTVQDAQGVVGDEDVLRLTALHAEAPVLSIEADAHVDEFASAAHVTVRLAEPSDEAVAFQIATQELNGASSANAGADFEPRTQSFMIPAGTTSIEFDISLIDDASPEAVEQFAVVISEAHLASGANVAIASPFATIEILDDDAPIAASIADVDVNEGDAAATFQVTLSGHRRQPVTLAWRTVDVTAEGGVDYQGSQGVVSIEPGASVASIRVPLIDDSDVESAKQFAVALAWPDGLALEGVTLEPSIAIATIEDNDGVEVSIRAELATVDERSGAAAFRVELAGPVEHEVVVRWATQAVSEHAGPTDAATGEDFAPASGTLVFSPSATASSQVIYVPILDDIVHEPQQTFSVGLTSVAGGHVQAGEARVQIESDDAPPELLIDDVVARETDAALTFTYRLSRPTESGDLGVAWRLAPAAGPTAAASGVDFALPAGLDHGVVWFPAGTTAPQGVAFPILADDAAEFLESLSLVLSGDSS